ncbi:SDR family oxidoreductase [Maribacter sp. MAR_2009_72]|uniref:SDR family oxidoreductase n=1 Tax=Maribacter sp. MAR_2009_72 TaxID=1250050 RepID=UPI001198E426|nr:SDR family oxidoreductase [Maribacter sp. MAR_2009_72]TVZ14546.1 short-subunit dehydrogenase [Maribacter sp. MAR_2009_72]
MQTFHNKIALVTGGASGIGEIMVRLLLERGATVIIWDIDDSAFTRLQSTYGTLGSLVLMKVDVTDIQSIHATAKNVLNNFNGVDFLINNAGIIVGKYLSEHTVADIDRTMQINANAPIHVTRAFINSMMERNTGHICNIASSGGLLSNPKMSVYVASKWSLIGFSESVRLEMEQLNKNIKVTTVMPYYIATGMFNGVRSKIPILEPEATALTIITSIENNKKMVTIPGYMYRLIRFAQAVLPITTFDWLTGKVLGVYHTMDHFTGRPPKE